MRQQLDFEDIAGSEGRATLGRVNWPTAFVSMVGSAATATIAIYALVRQGRNAEKARQHDRDLRRAERRAEAYVELLTALHRQQMQVDRTVPIFVEGQPPEPPSPLSDEALARDTLASSGV